MNDNGTHPDGLHPDDIVDRDAMDQDARAANDDLSEALADCLDRIAAGTPPDDAVAACPAAWRSEVAPLVHAALGVTALPARPPRPAFRAALHGELTRLEAEARAKDAAGAMGVTIGNDGRAMGIDGAPRAEHAPGWLGWLTKPRGAGIRRFALAPLAVLALLAGTAFVAAGGRPGDVLPGLIHGARQVLQSLWGDAGRPDTPPESQPGASGAREQGGVDDTRPSAQATMVNRRNPPADILRPAPPVAQVPLGATAADPRAAIAARPATPIAAVAIPVAPTAGVEPTTASSNLPAGGAKKPDIQPTETRSPPSTNTPTPAASPTSAGASSSSPTPTLEPGLFSIAGQVKRQAAAIEPLPLEGVEVRLVRLAVPSACRPDPPPVVARATTGADGGYRFDGIPAGAYLIAVERLRDPADPDCLPPRWRTASNLGVADLCEALPSAFAVDDTLGPARTAANINVFYAEGDRCGSGVAGE